MMWTAKRGFNHEKALYKRLKNHSPRQLHLLQTQSTAETSEAFGKLVVSWESEVCRLLQLMLAWCIRPKRPLATLHRHKKYNTLGIFNKNHRQKKPSN